MLQALIFDVDGTLSDTESQHLAAFNAAFAACDLDTRWSPDDYRDLLRITGGKERLSHYLHHHRLVGGSMSEDDAALIDRLHAYKTEQYVAAVTSGAIQLRPGILSLLTDARKNGLRLAIATTTSPANVTALLAATLGPDWPSWFEVIENAATATRKKPHPQVYLQALHRLGLAADDCLAFEDSAAGLQAAASAGLSVIVTPSPFTRDHDFTGALRLLPDLSLVTVDDLRDWHDNGQPTRMAVLG